MPQIDLKYSDSVQIDAKKILNELEQVINGCDSTAGVCKSRAYPTNTYVHDHVLLTVTFLKKPHRDDAFMKNISKQIETMLISYLPEGCYYAIDLFFSGDYYLTAQVNPRGTPE